MKKVLAVCAFLLIGFGLSAQGFYLDFNVGYGLGFPGEVIGQKTHTDIVNTDQTETSSNLKGTMGQGLNLQLTPGYMFNEHIGIELGLNYFLGSKITVDDQTSNITVDALSIKNAEYSSSNTTVKSNQFRIIPTLYLSTGTSNTLSAYAKAGLVLPVSGKSTATMHAVDASVAGSGIDKDIIDATSENKGAFSLGFRGAIGINYKLGDKLSIFGEIYTLALQIKSKSSEITSYTYNGKDVLSSMTTYDKETNYVKELNKGSNNYDYNDNASDGKPEDELFQKSNFNQTGIQLGVKFTF